MAGSGHLSWSCSPWTPLWPSKICFTALARALVPHGLDQAGLSFSQVGYLCTINSPETQAFIKLQCLVPGVICSHNSSAFITAE